MAWKAAAIHEYLYDRRKVTWLPCDKTTKKSHTSHDNHVTLQRSYENATTINGDNATTIRSAMSCRGPCARHVTINGRTCMLAMSNLRSRCHRYMLTMLQISHRSPKQAMILNRWHFRTTEKKSHDYRVTKRSERHHPAKTCQPITNTHHTDVTNPPKLPTNKKHPPDQRHNKPH